MVVRLAAWEFRKEVPRGPGQDGQRMGKRKLRSEDVKGRGRGKAVFLAALFLDFRTGLFPALQECYLLVFHLASDLVFLKYPGLQNYFLSHTVPHRSLWNSK